MPRPDGVLYNYEKAAIKREQKAKLPPVKLGRPPKPKPPEQPPGPKGVVSTEITGDYVNKGGRIPVLKKLTPQAIDAALADIRLGLSWQSALVRQGISKAAVDKWRARNPALNSRFEQAEMDFERDMVSRINGFACNDAKPAQWLLERRLPQWQTVSRTEVTGKDGKDLSVSHLLFASVAGAQGEQSKARKVIDVTPPKPALAA